MECPGVVPIPLQDDYSLIQVPNRTNNHSILIILQEDANGFLCFSNQILFEGDMPLPRVRSLGGSLCPAMSQDCALSLEVFVVEGSDGHGSSG